MQQYQQQAQLHRRRGRRQKQQPSPDAAGGTRCGLSQTNGEQNYGRLRVTTATRGCSCLIYRSEVGKIYSDVLLRQQMLPVISGLSGGLLTSNKMVLLHSRIWILELLRKQTPDFMGPSQFY